MSDRVFGEIPGIPIGSTFASREDLSRAGVHRPTQAGISGAQDEGADSIVLSGGYEDDEDFGDLIVYTGHGGQDPISRKQVAHQALTHKNLALAVSMQQGLPVRVIRGASHHSRFAPQQGYRYDGLYTVEQFWHAKGTAGFTVWRFRLIRQPGPATTSSQGLADFAISSGNAVPARIQKAVNRVIRDTVLSGQIKILYDFSCQVCGARLVGPAGPYAEAAHVRPLGTPHNGPDTADNLICLCPNHHYLFDVGAFGIRDDLTFVGIAGQLRVHRRHALSPEHLRYHRQHFGLLDGV